MQVRIGEECVLTELNQLLTSTGRVTLDIEDPSVRSRSPYIADEETDVLWNSVMLEYLDGLSDASGMPC